MPKTQSELPSENTTGPEGGSDDESVESKSDSDTKSPTSSQELGRKVLELSNKKSSILLYKFGRLFIRVAGHRYFRTKIEGKDNLKLSGRFIIAPVHRSNLDAPLINSINKRRIRSLAKINMFGSKLGIYISAIIGCIPVDRKINDRDALKTAAKLLESGEAMLLFPEGVRGSGPNIQKIFGGCAYLAIRTSTPVIPVGISGTEACMPSGKKFPNRGHVNIEIGEALFPPEKNTKSARNKFTAQIHSALQDLQDTANSRTSK